jgi:hypothetical protein
MNCKSFFLWLGTCLLGLLGMAGCRHSDSSCSSCTGNSSVAPYSYSGGPILQSLRSVSRPGILPEHVCAPTGTISPDMSGFACCSSHANQPAAASIEPVDDEAPQEGTVSAAATAKPSAIIPSATPSAAIPAANDTIRVIKIPKNVPEPQLKATGESPIKQTRYMENEQSAAPVEDESTEVILASYAESEPTVAKGEEAVPTVPHIERVSVIPAVQVVHRAVAMACPARAHRVAVPPEAGFPRGEPEPRRGGYVDVTAAPCFNHNRDYTHLTGQVEYSCIGNCWRLRYASVDETDCHGGSVTLLDCQKLKHLCNGQYISVCGHLTNPEDTASSPLYRVQSLKRVANVNDTDQEADGQ